MEKLIILGHKNPDVDSIVSGYLLEKILNKKGYNAEFVIPDDKIEEESLSICRRYGLDPLKFKKKINLADENIKYILVDHNERNLKGKVICIIDHHPTNKTINMDNYYNNRISSTACYISSRNEDLLDTKDLKLAIVATLIDTASFHSTKSREEDRIWAINLCKKYNFNYDELYKDCLCITDLNDLNKVSLNGFKQYNIDNKKVETSYIQVEDWISKEKEINIILEILKNRVIKNNIDMFIFIVHDMNDFKTMYYYITKEKIEERYYDVYCSRGDTIIPEIRNKIKSI